MSSIFGNFGQSNASTQPQQPSAFGASTTGTNQQQPSSNIFGGGATTGSNMFGGGSSTAQPAFGGAATGQQAAPGSNLFGGGGGANGTQPGAGSSLFGGGATSGTQPAAGTNIFGGGTTTGTQPSSNIFGSGATQPATGSNLFGGGGATTGTQPAAGSSLFGGGGTATGTQPTTGSNLFGGGGGFGGGTGTAAGAQSTNTLFGGASTSQQPATGGGLFGSSTTTQPSTTNTLFGGGGNGATGGSTLFGGGSSTAGNGGGLFGQSTTGSSWGGSTLGGQPSASTYPLFGGGPSTTQPANSLFGASAAPKPPGTSLFGSTAPTLGATTSSSGNLFASRANATMTTLPQQQAADAQVQYAALTQRIEGIHNAWNPNSPYCRFKHFFYNVVDPSEVSRFGRPQNATDDALWQKAVRENPDPTCHVPVLAVGFDDLQKRVEAQAQQALAQQEKLKELKKHIDGLGQRHDASNVSRQQRAAAAQAQLMHRIIKLIRKLHMIIPALRSSSIRPEEDKLRAALEKIEEEVRKPGGLGRMRGKLNELWAFIGALNAALERDGKLRADGSVQWAVVDEEGLGQVAQVLADQQAGLAHLTKILQKDQRDLDFIVGQTPKEEISLSSLPSSLNLSSVRR